MFAEIGPLSCFISHHVSSTLIETGNNDINDWLTNFWMFYFFLVHTGWYAVLSEWKSTLLQITGRRRGYCCRGQNSPENRRNASWCNGHCEYSLQNNCKSTKLIVFFIRFSVRDRHSYGRLLGLGGQLIWRRHYFIANTFQIAMLFIFIFAIKLKSNINLNQIFHLCKWTYWKKKENKIKNKNFVNKTNCLRIKCQIYVYVWSVWHECVLTFYFCIQFIVVMSW